MIPGYTSFIEYLEKRHPDFVKKVWVKRMIFIGFVLSCILTLLLFSVLIMDQLGFDYKKSMRERFPSCYKCEGFHGITGEVKLPPGYESDMSKISIEVVSKGKSEDPTEECRYILKIKDFTFNQEMNDCSLNEKLEFFVREGSDKYQVYDTHADVCGTGISVKLK